MVVDFLRAFTFVFSDRHWLIKLAKPALLVLLCPLPVVGLFCLCALLGCLAEIAHNVSNDYPRPLPAWNHIGQDISKGAPVLLALIVYHLPPLGLITLLYFLRGSLAVSLFGSLTFTGLLAAIMPFLMIFFAFAWSLLAIGLVYYADNWEAGAFFQFSKLLRSMGRDSVLTAQWLVASLAASMLLLILLPLAPFLFFPVQGYLAGVYGRRLRAAWMAARNANTAHNERNALRFAKPDGRAPLPSKLSA